MKYVLLKHPPFFGSRSMVRFHDAIEGALRRKGHLVEVWQPTKVFYTERAPVGLRKWLGYIDQHIIFTAVIKRRRRHLRGDAIFVLPDQALGTWVPAICDAPHVIHCHDLLALRSAKGEFRENRTGFSGKLYQRLIHRGFSHGRAFISISEATKRDLARFVKREPLLSEVVYNGLSYPYRPIGQHERDQVLGGLHDRAPDGCLLHVGADVWYKNRSGVLKIYRAYVRANSNPLPLWIVGGETREGGDAANISVEAPGVVEVLPDLPDHLLNAVYSHARALLFPSYEEGFGWPLIEAMACGVPVITTRSVPMTEVCCESAWFLRRRTEGDPTWAIDGAALLEACLSESAERRRVRVEAGLQRASLFSGDRVHDRYEEIYNNVFGLWGTSAA